MLTVRELVELWVLRVPGVSQSGLGSELAIVVGLGLGFGLGDVEGSWSEPSAIPLSY